MNSVTVRKLMRLMLTIIVAAVTVGFCFVVPGFLAPESEVGLLGVIFKVLILIAAWVFVYKLWKIKVQPIGSDI